MSKKEKAMKTTDAERLRLRCPGLYSDFMAGRIPSARGALELAGLRPGRNRLQKLQHSWKKAAPKERQAFLTWLSKESEADLPLQVAPSGPADAPIANGRYLLPQTIIRLETIMAARGITPAGVMRDLGFGADDRTLLRAMARKTCLRLKVIEALECWLRSHEMDGLTP